jgi:copper chaperone NosL
MRALTSLAVAASLVGACANDGSGAQPIKYDRDTCTACGMAISEPAYAAELVPPGGRAVKFDDVGCALTWLDRQSFALAPNVKLWLVDPKGGFVDGRTARYVAGRPTPMGYGFERVAFGPLDFESIRARVHAVAAQHDTKGAP